MANVVAGFCVTARGYSYFPFGGSTLSSRGRAVGRREQTKSALHFWSEKPLPLALVRKLINVRITETKK